MPDQILRCKDCQKDFPFTEGEQAFFAQKEFPPPKRCKPCRVLNRTAQPSPKLSIDVAHGIYDDLPDGAYFAAMEEATGCDPATIVGHLERKARLRDE